MQHEKFSLRGILRLYVPAEQWRRAEKIANKTGRRIGDVLLEQSQLPNLPQGFRVISDYEIAQGLALYFHLHYEPLIDENNQVVAVDDSPELKEIIDKMADRVSPFYRGKYMPMFCKPISLKSKDNADQNTKHYRRNYVIVVAFHDPYHLLDCKNYLDFIARELGYSGIQAVFSTARAVQIAYKEYFPDDEILGISDNEAANKRKLEELARNEEIVKLVDNLIIGAIHKKASDIHIKCYKDEVAIKYRIDGMLVEQEPVSLSQKNALIARIKILSGLNILERRLPQDGRISTPKYEELNVQSMRVSTLPMPDGESIVIRLLSGQKKIQPIDCLGLHASVLSELYTVLKEPQGLFLVTGPTGSGKSTTLASLLQYLNDLHKRQKNVLTVEDPIEYTLDGATQVAVNEKVGLTFAKVLRAALRQDPNIILVGEIRDLETVEIAMRAAMTGHQVFSTLHTNDATSAMMRLLDMSVPPYMIGATINGVLAQRLVRKLCVACKTPILLEKMDWDQVGMMSDKASELIGEPLPASIYQASLCDKCDQSGYMGRYPIFELFRPNEQIRSLFLSKESALDNGRIRRAARENAGMITLREDGICKMFQGITSLAEVIRVTSEDN